MWGGHGILCHPPNCAHAVNTSPHTSRGGHNKDQNVSGQTLFQKKWQV